MLRFHEPHQPAHVPTQEDWAEYQQWLDSQEPAEFDDLPDYSNLIGQDYDPYADQPLDTDQHWFRKITSGQLCPIDSSGKVKTKHGKPVVTRIEIRTPSPVTAKPKVKVSTLVNQRERAEKESNIKKYSAMSNLFKESRSVFGHDDIVIDDRNADRVGELLTKILH